MERARLHYGWRFLAPLFTAVLWLGAGLAAAQGVAIVTDVSGKVAGPGAVSILSEIAADARVKLRHLYPQFET